MVFLGNPEYGCELQPIDFSMFARACGGTGFTIEDPRECGRLVEQALNTPGPVVVDAIVDPFEAPMDKRRSLRNHRSGYCALGSEGTPAGCFCYQAIRKCGAWRPGVRQRCLHVLLYRALTRQLSGWASQGIKMVKMKVGTKPSDDSERVKAARMAIGQDVQLFVDANGA
jgi:Enolase C-terminal domain-like/Thiamine pyrophosphate enzyme, C-terminal TPP binding domain